MIFFKKNLHSKITEHVLEKLRQQVTLAVSLSLLFLGTNAKAATKTELERADENKKIASCYSRLAEEAYNLPPPGTTVCQNTQNSHQDNRNGMGEWKVATNQSASYKEVLTVFERESGNGQRRELAFGFRGSESKGDWLRDGESQFFIGTSLKDNDISNLASAPKIDIEGRYPKFFRGFHTRFLNLAPDIAQQLDDLQDWQQQSPGRSIGVKTAGHSLGAAASQIAGLYIGDRYHGTDVDVEVFAYNSPKIANKSMAETYRKAASSCGFNLHIFNNSYDGVSKVPMPGHQLVGQSHNIGSANFDHNTCIYHAIHRSSYAGSGVHLPSITHPLNNILSQAVQFGFDQHDVKQWQYNEAGAQLLRASAPVAASWFPLQPLGGSTLPPLSERNTVRGPFKAAIFYPTSGNFWHSLLGGGSDIRAIATGSFFNRFEFEPIDTDCLRHGSSVRIRTKNGINFVTAVGGQFNGSAQLNGGVYDGNGQWSNIPEATVFEFVNHTNKYDCIAENDSFSLKTHENRFVSGNSSGDLNSQATDIGPQEKFEIQDMVTTPRRLLDVENPSDSGHGIEPPYEAEDAEIVGGRVKSNHPGYSGLGFVDYKRNGNSVEFEVRVPTAGQYTLEFRYANASTRDRSADLFVDDTLIRNMPFSPTGSWATYSTSPKYEVGLEEGTNFIAVVATSGGPNLDSLYIEKVKSCQPSSAIATVKTSNSITHNWSTLSFDGLGVGHFPSVFPAMQTFNGPDTAHVRLDLDAYGGAVDYKIEEEQSLDSEIDHDNEEVGFVLLGTENLFIRNQAGEIIGEQIFDANDHNWKVKNFSHTYQNPVVIAHSDSFSGPEPAHIRIRNVTANSFEYKVEEWHYLDDSHVTEYVSAMVIEAGVHTLRDGQKIVAGSQQVDQNTRDVFSIFTFPEHFDSAPVVLSQLQTFNGGDPVVTRMRSINARSFEILVQEEESWDNVHDDEVIGYIAVEGNSSFKNCP